ncbi:hypothetical protein [Aestuariivita sp.]|uniref:hypothetical protein n=1 Tax=Aestuariivita sp. TaxID=1872407 RepID=UPI0021749DBE|nr:hypothetical protein [Aestuariivita sp.]MCE8005987.1 hypothetical protein [Aestuariivita sp.]
MRSYEAARGMFSFLGFCSWIVILLGGFVALGGMSAGSSLGRNAGAMQAMLAAAPGLILAMVGFYGLALVQMGRASVDSAEYGQQALQVARDQLEVSRQALQQGRQMAASYAVAANKPSMATAKTDPQLEGAGPSYGNRTEPAPPTSGSDETAKIEPKAETASLPSPGGETTVDELLGEKITVAGRELVLVEGTYRYRSIRFSSLEKAEAYFAPMGVNPAAKSRST